MSETHNPSKKELLLRWIWWNDVLNVARVVVFWSEEAVDRIPRGIHQRLKPRLYV